MKALVINLDNAKDRMMFQKQQLQSLDIKYKRLPAFILNIGNSDIYEKYYDTWERPMSVTEVSCFFSHKSAWDQIIEANEPMLVLEDDAVLANTVSCVLNELDKQNNIDYVNLEERKNRKRILANKSTSEICDSSLVRLYQGRSGAAAYVLWPSGAKKLLLQMKKNGIGIADKFINANYSLISYQVEPAIAIQLDQCTFHGIKAPFEVHSSISPKTSLAKSDYSWNYRFKRIQGTLKIALNQLRHFHHAKRRQIAVSDQFEILKTNAKLNSDI